ncbi:hypothetical protein [Halogeometricum borinquense]|uniref:hypothetical protein n=1 Tax=Halogeometricum borinquense TaxID=60847 RepID=UPI000320A993|nr:hypothetical protein [Halogeometricum borinquense]
MKWDVRITRWNLLNAVKELLRPILPVAIVVYAVIDLFADAWVTEQGPSMLASAVDGLGFVTVGIVGAVLVFDITDWLRSR